MYIDTHAHLTMPEYSDLSEVLQRAQEAKVELIINASFDLESSKAGIKLAENYENIYAAVGIHPHDAPLVTKEALDEIRRMAAHKKVAAIGETGLDYYKNISPRDAQQSAFRKFLQLTQELDRPVIIHCRDAQADLSSEARSAQEDVMRIMREENQGKLQAVFHCFAGDDELIKFSEQNGFLISFTGNITFNRAQKVKENAKKVPLEMLMLETDCPYLSPEPFRGKRNEPSYVPYIAKAIAELKGVSVEELAQVTTRNAKRFFKL